MKTLRVELKVDGEVKTIWVTLGKKKDVETLRFGIDKLFDEIENNNQ